MPRLCLTRTVGQSTMVGDCELLLENIANGSAVFVAISKTGKRVRFTLDRYEIVKFDAFSFGFDSFRGPTKINVLIEAPASVHILRAEAIRKTPRVASRRDLDFRGDF